MRSGKERETWEPQNGHGGWLSACCNSALISWSDGGSWRVLQHPCVRDIPFHPISQMSSQGLSPPVHKLNLRPVILAAKCAFCSANCIEKRKTKICPCISYPSVCLSTCLFISILCIIYHLYLLTMSVHRQSVYLPSINLPNKYLFMYLSST